MATLSSILAWRIPGTGAPGGLQSIELHGVRHDCHDSIHARLGNYRVKCPRTGGLEPDLLDLV